MKNDHENCGLLARCLVANLGKNEIIAEIFRLFSIDCLERCRLEPMLMDSLIKEFYECEGDCTAVLADIIRLIKHSQKETKDKEGELIKTVLDYIDSTYLQDISVEKMAADLHISYYYMCHIFKSVTGMSVNTCRIRKRLEKAMRMLVESDEKVSDIATFCGYNSISYFTETFTKYIGVSPTAFRDRNKNIRFHSFYNYDDMRLATQLPSVSFLDNGIKEIKQNVFSATVCLPDDKFKFLHEAAIIEYNGVLYASWYHCPKNELQGYTPICGKRSFDGGKTWSELEILCDDKSGKILYCPPVYGICDGKLYMFVNQMVAPDCMHSLDLYVFDTASDKFMLLWSKPIPFKLNTNVVVLPNGKLMLPGRCGKIDTLPTTPAVLISDSGKIDAEWRLVEISKGGILPCDAKLICPEISVICAKNKLYMFCRNDMRTTTLVYISDDNGETWSTAFAHDIPCISSKIYCGSLSDGRHYILCNTDKTNRTMLTAYFTDDSGMRFTKKLVLFDTNENVWGAMHYPAACEYDGYLYVIATKGCENSTRGAQLFKIKIDEI